MSWADMSYHTVSDVTLPVLARKGSTTATSMWISSELDAGSGREALFPATMHDCVKESLMACTGGCDDEQVDIDRREVDGQCPVVE